MTSWNILYAAPGSYLNIKTQQGHLCPIDIFFFYYCRLSKALMKGSWTLPLHTNMTYSVMIMIQVINVEHQHGLIGYYGDVIFGGNKIQIVSCNKIYLNSKVLLTKHLIDKDFKLLCLIYTTGIFKVQFKQVAPYFCKCRI